MALSPAFQLQPSYLFDSLLSSRLHFLRLSSSTKLKSHLNSIHNQSPSPNSSPFPARSNHRRSRTSDDLSSKSSWIRSWVDAQTRALALPKRPSEVLDYREGLSSDDDDVGTSRSTGSTTMEKIVEKLKKFGYIDDSHERKERPLPERGSVEDIFYAEDGILPDSRGGLSLNLNEEVRFPWEKPLEGNGGGRELGLERKKKSRTSVAELTLPEGELRRLRHMAIRMKSKTKIGGAGVTKEIVDLIHEKWKTSEVVRLKCEGPPALNMKRMHEILERKTGGLVIWRSGTSISLYRGVTYEVPQPVKRPYESTKGIGLSSSSRASYNSYVSPTKDHRLSNASDHRQGLTAPAEKENKNELHQEIKYEDEIDKLLDDLGPRYSDWPGGNPLPVDADLLLTVPDYKPPFRVLPYGVKPSLGLKEGTALRRLARVLPPHFALGRSRQHQGLAAAMVKLWEKSSIAKIGLKRGVQLTSSERMAEDIKKLTGGTILSRNKDYLVFYRGKDFLSPEVTEALLERERLAKFMQDDEEKARLRAASSISSNIETVEEPSATGTLVETLEADARWGSRLDDNHANKMIRAAEMARHADLVRKLERKFFLAEKKKMKAERTLAKVEESLKPAESSQVPDIITDEERFMFRKLGLRMKAFLLLGRRGVFDGTVENMHLHWKYRELVKVIVKAKTFAQVKSIALSLEAESGGILVSVDKISKGFAIIVYRGKDYQRPPMLRPKNLLTKRKALARSIELQRREALNRHITNLNKRAEQLNSELIQMENVKDQGDENLYAKLDSAYSSEEEDTEDEDEDEDEDAYLDTLDSVLDIDSEQSDGAEAYLGDEEGEEESNDYDENDNESEEDEGADHIDTSRNLLCDQQSEGQTVDNLYM